MNARPTLRILALSILGALLEAGTAAAWDWDGSSGPSDVGPYAVGHARYLFVDASHSIVPVKNKYCPVKDKSECGMPVVVSMWYPTDPETIGNSTPLAQYPLDPFFNYLPVTSSGDWEPLGIQRAYEGVSPSTQGPFPLLVVSPGWNARYWFYIFLATRVASHGYVVAVLEHLGDGQWSDASLWPSPYFHLLATAAIRNHDISFTITQLLAKSGSPGDALHGLLDSGKIAAAGHSLGGYGAYSVAGGDDLVCDAKASHVMEGGDPWPMDYLCFGTSPDRRVKAIIAMDGSSQFSRFEELERISVPSLIMGQPVSWWTYLRDSLGWEGIETFIARPHAAIDRPDSYRVDIEGSGHYSFSNICAGVEVLYGYGVLSADDVGRWLDMFGCPRRMPDAEAHSLIAAYVVAFLNTHLGDARYGHVLTPGYAVSNRLPVEFFQNERCDAPLPDDSYFTYRVIQGSDECRIGAKNPSTWFVDMP